MHAIRIDRTKSLSQEPHCGHNRYHPDVAPVLEVGEGEEVALETRDALDGQITPQTTVADFPNLNRNMVHPLTGPVFVKGAEPGDLLEIEFADIVPQPVGYTSVYPGGGFLHDVGMEAFLAHWRLKDGWATSEQIPGVRVPGAPFMGISAVAPSATKLAEWNSREDRVRARGGRAWEPEPSDAVPAGRCGLEGLRTLPPRENGGNFDVKQLTKGSKLYLPVFVEGALFSTGDAHFAQGDGEVCLTAIEMGGTAIVRFRVHKGAAARRMFSSPVFSHERYFADPKFAMPERFLGVMGMPISDKGEIEHENLNLACRNALLNMIELLGERGYSREQAYVICSVAVDLRISNVVDLPNFVVSALLPEAIFDGD